MDAFTFKRPTTASAAIALQSTASTRFVAGGTNLIDMMKLNVERPRALVDINALPLAQITSGPGGSLMLGALTRNSDVAHNDLILRDYPVLSEALLSGASPQLRNMATTGGNLLQRTRCVYFRDSAQACNKREPGTGCSAIGGHNRNLAILGTSEHCIATNPSDQNVALTALDARIHVQGPKGARIVPISDFYLEPGTTPQRETVLEPGDLITAVELPAPRPGSKQIYLKLRDRAAYEFALVSAAIVLNLDGKRITSARVVLGGVGTKPWRSHEAEKTLTGQPIDRAIFTKAAEAALTHARPSSENGYKVELAKRCLTRALTQAVTA